MKLGTTTVYSVSQLCDSGDHPARWIELSDGYENLDDAKRELKRYRKDFPRSRYGITSRTVSIEVVVGISE